MTTSASSYQQGFADGQADERAQIAAYLRDRARWLRAEREAGGCRSLTDQAAQCDYLAAQVEAGRRAGSHLR